MFGNLKVSVNIFKKKVTTIWSFVWIKKIVIFNPLRFDPLKEFVLLLFRDIRLYNNMIARYC